MMSAAAFEKPKDPSYLLLPLEATSDSYERLDEGLQTRRDEEDLIKGKTRGKGNGDSATPSLWATCLAVIIPICLALISLASAGLVAIHISDWFSPAAAETSRGSLCAPSPGMLVINQSEALPLHRQARYIPLSAVSSLATRNLTGLETGLGYNDGFDLLDEYISSTETPDYLVGKTVLLLGDSQDRFTTDHLCTSLVPDAVLSYRNFFTSTSPQHDLFRPDTPEDWQNAVHHCLLPGGTQIWAFMTYGSISGNDTYARTRPNQGPDELMQRIRLIGKAFRDAGITIDLLIMRTMTWDLDAANLIDAVAERPANPSLPLEQVELFRNRTREALTLVNERIPLAQRAAKLYRTMHNFVPLEGTWFYADTPPETEQIPRTPFANNKASQLNTAMLDLIPQYGFMPYELGRAQSGYIGDYPDDRHFGPVGRLLHTQMILCQLKALHDGR